MKDKVTFFAKSLEKTFKIYYNIGGKPQENEFYARFAFKKHQISKGKQ